MSNQPEVPEKYREIKPGAYVAHVWPNGEVESEGTVSKPPFFIEYGVSGPGDWNWDGWFYEVDESESFQMLCSAAHVIEPAPEAPETPPSAESRLAEIAGLVREFKESWNRDDFNLDDMTVDQFLERIEQLTKGDEKNG